MGVRELDIEERHQRMNIVVASDVDGEGGRKRQVLLLHCGDIHAL